AYPRARLRPRRPAPAACGLGRLGLLGAEGEGDLLLRRARSAAVPDSPRPELPAPRARARRHELPAHGLRRHDRAGHAVLVPPRGVPRRGRRAAARTRVAGRRLALPRARRRPARGRPPAVAADRRLAARLLLRPRGAVTRALAPHRRALAAAPVRAVPRRDH